PPGRQNQRGLVLHGQREFHIPARREVSAASTRFRVYGYPRKRTPVASKNALAKAAAAMTSSPAPVDFSLTRCTTIGMTSGHSSNRSIEDQGRRLFIWRLWLAS